MRNRPLLWVWLCGWMRGSEGGSRVPSCGAETKEQGALRRLRAEKDDSNADSVGQQLLV